MNAILSSDIIPLDSLVDPSPELLALNNAHAAELSFLSRQRFATLIGEAFIACRVSQNDALLLTFDQSADYDSPNFLWFRERLKRFVYVDRIVVGPEARGPGLARKLYEHLFERARAGGQQRIVCEVNTDPPNPASDAFHASLGFTEIGSALLSNGKTVRYFSRELR